MRYKLRGALLRKGLPQVPLFVLVIAAESWSAGKRRFERPEVFYLINAVQRNGIWELPFPVEAILNWAWQRWEVEVTHRDMKAGFGVGQTQYWNPRAAIASVQWMFWLYAIMLFSAFRAWGWTRSPALACAWWRGSRRWSFNTVWRSFRIALRKLPSRWLSLLDSVLAAARA
jgi:hypothetical protein